jgi:hypothetical protein
MDNQSEMPGVSRGSGQIVQSGRAWAGFRVQEQSEFQGLKLVQATNARLTSGNHCQVDQQQRQRLMPRSRAWVYRLFPHHAFTAQRRMQGFSIGFNVGSGFDFTWRNSVRPLSIRRVWVLSSDVKADRWRQ